MPSTAENPKSSASKRAAVTPSRRITAFGRVSKSAAPLSGNKEVAGLENHAASRVQKAGITSAKRKLEDLQQTPVQKKARITWAKVVDPFVEGNTKATAPTAQLSSPPIPSKPRKIAPLRSKHVDSPTKGARAILESFFISPSVRPRDTSPVPSQGTKQTSSPCTEPSPCPIRKEPLDHAAEIQDLIDLASSFLTALSLHYAHNGSFAPADIRIITPSIERAWGKRRITTIDIQRLLGILQSTATPSPLTLSDYGNNKVCIELTTEAIATAPRLRPLNVEHLNNLYASTLHTRRSAHQPLNGTTFLASLPLAPIIPLASVSQLGPLLAKGQLRLSELRSGFPKTPPSTASPKSAAPPTVTSKARGASLLDRIRAKELVQSNLPVPLTPEQRARRSALQRLEEIAPVLELMATGTSGAATLATLGASSSGRLEVERTFSFTMPTLVQNLQMSLRNPISKDEAVLCVKLLAEEVAPRWIGVTEIGKVIGVRVRKGKGIGRDELRERVGKALQDGGKA